MTSIDHVRRTQFRVQSGGTSSGKGDPLPRLLGQILHRAGEGATVERATTRPWASALFQGRRHVVMVRLAGEQAEQQACRFMDGIEDAEWDLKGHFVADITIDDGLPYADGYLVELSALTIEDW